METPTKKTPEVTDIHLRELLAFELTRSAISGSETRDATADKWRSLPEAERAEIREQTRRIMRRLTDHGVVLRTTSSKRVLEALDELITIPARPAYVLGPPEPKDK